LWSPYASLINSADSADRPEPLCFVRIPVLIFSWFWFLPRLRIELNHCGILLAGGKWSPCIETAVTSRYQPLSKQPESKQPFSAVISLGHLAMERSQDLSEWAKVMRCNAMGGGSAWMTASLSVYLCLCLARARWLLAWQRLCASVSLFTASLSIASVSLLAAPSLLRASVFTSRAVLLPQPPLKLLH
jgi:hypothetical protein